MEKINLYKQHNSPINLALPTSGKLINNPMYNRDVKLYKGILNKIEFSIKNQDRKTLSLQDKRLNLFIHNLENTKSAVIPLKIKDIHWGKYEARIEDWEIEDFDAGFYNAYVVAYNDEHEEEILYTGANWENRFEIEIISGVYDTFVPSKEIDINKLLYQTYKNNDKTLTPYYLTSIIKANESCYQGLQFYFDNFDGELTILGNNELNINENIKDWFEIDTLKITNKDETIGKTYKCCCQWIRLKINPQGNNEGKITKILYRN